MIDDRLSDTENLTDNINIVIKRNEIHLRILAISY